MFRCCGLLTGAESDRPAIYLDSLKNGGIEDLDVMVLGNDVLVNVCDTSFTVENLGAHVLVTLLKRLSCGGDGCDERPDRGRIIARDFSLWTRKAQG